MVYVGTRQYKYGRMKMSHMMATTLQELHQAAQALGVHRKHFQDKKRPHYDICQNNRSQALKMGSILVDDRELIKMLNCGMIEKV